jgi:hypothetical protein
VGFIGEIRHKKITTENPMSSDENQEQNGISTAGDSANQVVSTPTKASTTAADKPKASDNKVIRLLEKNPLGMTLVEMAGGPRQLKKIKLLRPMLAEAIKDGLVMPVSQRAGNTVYRLVKFLGPR